MKMAILFSSAFLMFSGSLFAGELTAPAQILSNKKVQQKADSIDGYSFDSFQYREKVADGLDLYEVALLKTDRSIRGEKRICFHVFYNWFATSKKVDMDEKEGFYPCSE